MEIRKLLAVIITMIALACSIHGLSFTVDKENWVSKNWQDEPFEERLASEVESLIKRSKAHQFYGLMGKRSDMSQPTRMDRKRNKGEMFVGLMGRRALMGAEKSTAINAAMESNKQSDLQEEWDNLQFY